MFTPNPCSPQEGKPVRLRFSQLNHHSFNNRHHLGSVRSYPIVLMVGAAGNPLRGSHSYVGLSEENSKRNYLRSIPESRRYRARKLPKFGFREDGR